MPVKITERSTGRVVDVAGRQRGFGGLAEHTRIETYYSRETLEALLAAKGEMWLRDEIARSEEPGYVEEPLRRQFERFGPIVGQQVLDFGCGCAGSTLCLGRLGAASVIGVEPRGEFVEAARLRLRDSGMADRVSIRHVPDTRKLPFSTGMFDAVVMNAVLEHIPPAARREHLAEAWRVIVPGGHLLIAETPNRLWPKDSHTTGLWFVPFLPLGLARQYAIARGKAPADASLEWLLSEGIRGVTYWEVMSALEAGVRCLNRTKGDDVVCFWAPRLSRTGQSPGRLRMKRVFRTLHAAVDRAVLLPLAVPATAFLPELSLCLEKPAA